MIATLKTKNLSSTDCIYFILYKYFQHIISSNMEIWPFGATLYTITNYRRSRHSKQDNSSY